MRDVILLIVGGILAMIGGVITEYLKFNLEDKRKIRALRTLILDEINSVLANIDTILEIYRTRSEIMVIHIEKFKELWQSYEGIRGELFLVKDEDLRKEIIKFYSSLKTLVKESEDLLGKIPQTEQEKNEFKSDQDRRIGAFRDLKSTGEDIKTKI
jgi:hypothetical protein